MLSLFPELLFLAPFSALLIRVALAIVFGYAASRHVMESDMSMRTLGVVEGVCSVLLFLGFYTQGAALLGLLLCGLHAYMPRFRLFPRSTEALVAILCVSLLVTGAGPLAFDLPL